MDTNIYILSVNAGASSTGKVAALFFWCSGPRQTHGKRSVRPAMWRWPPGREPHVKKVSRDGRSRLRLIGGGGGLSSAYAPVRPILGKEAGIMVSRAKRQQSRGPEPCCNTYIPILSSWRHKPLPWKVIGFECRPRTGFLCPVCGMPHDGRLAGRQKAM